MTRTTASLSDDLAQARLKPEPLSDTELEALKLKYPEDVRIIEEYDACYTDVDGMFSDAACTPARNNMLHRALPQSAFEPHYVDWAIDQITGRKSADIATDDFLEIVHNLILQAQDAERIPEAAAALKDVSQKTNLNVERKAAVLVGYFELANDDGWTAIYQALKQDHSGLGSQVIHRLAELSANPVATQVLFNIMADLPEQRDEAVAELCDVVNPAAVTVIDDTLQRFHASDNHLYGSPSEQDAAIGFAMLRIEAAHHEDYDYRADLIPYLSDPGLIGTQAMGFLSDDTRYNGDALWSFFKNYPWGEYPNSMAQTRLLYVICILGKSEASLPFYRMLKSNDGEVRALANTGWTHLVSSGKAFPLVLGAGFSNLANIGPDAEEVHEAKQTALDLFRQRRNLKIDDQAQFNLLLALEALYLQDTVAAGAYYRCAKSFQPSEEKLWAPVSSFFNETELNDLKKFAKKSPPQPRLMASDAVPEGITIEVDRQVASLPLVVLPGVHWVSTKDVEGNTVSSQLVIVGTKDQTVSLFNTDATRDFLQAELDDAPTAPLAADLSTDTGVTTHTLNTSVTPDATWQRPVLPSANETVLRTRSAASHLPANILTGVGAATLLGAGIFSLYQYSSYRGANGEMSDMIADPTAFSATQFTETYNARESAQAQAQIFAGVGAGGALLMSAGLVWRFGGHKERGSGKTHQSVPQVGNSMLDDSRTEAP